MNPLNMRFVLRHIASAEDAECVRRLMIADRLQWACIGAAITCLIAAVVSP